jgi:hypothetical protein
VSFLVHIGVCNTKVKFEFQKDVRRCRFSFILVYVISIKVKFEFQEDVRRCRCRFSNSNSSRQIGVCKFRLNEVSSNVSMEIKL